MKFYKILHHCNASSSAKFNENFSFHSPTCATTILNVFVILSVTLVTCNDYFFEFLKVQWLHFAGEVDKLITFWREISTVSKCQKLLKIDSFFTQLFNELEGYHLLKHGECGHTWRRSKSKQCIAV